MFSIQYQEHDVQHSIPGTKCSVNNNRDKMYLNEYKEQYVQRCITGTR